MSDKLEIIIITYNRKNYVKRTIETFLDDLSPVRNCMLTVLDNNSYDGTDQEVATIAAKHQNIRYVRNRYNLGISGNIFRAMEIADHEYVWIVGDDDVYDFSGWGAVDAAMGRREQVICVSRYAIPDGLKDDVGAQLCQLSFITGGIVCTKLYSDDSMHDAIYGIHHLFPHLVPIVHYINAGGRLFVVDKAIADNGMLRGEEKDCSYVRGVQDTSVLSPRVRGTTWITGWASLCQGLANSSVRQHVFVRGMEVIHGNMRLMIDHLKINFQDPAMKMLLGEVAAVLPHNKDVLQIFTGPCWYMRMVIRIRESVRYFRYYIGAHILFGRAKRYYQKRIASYT